MTKCGRVFYVAEGWLTQFAQWCGIGPRRRTKERAMRDAIVGKKDPGVAEVCVRAIDYATESIQDEWTQTEITALLETYPEANA